MADGKKREAEEQTDVLTSKDHVLDSTRGLQVYGDESLPDKPHRQGTGGIGTAERAARITAAQEASMRKSKQKPETE